MKIVAAGCSLGLFVGLLIGLSNSPVVGTVLGAMLPLVVLIASGFSTAQNPKVPLLSIDDAFAFITCFGIVGAAALSVGMFYRNWDDTLSVSSAYAQLKQIGLKDEEARAHALQWFDWQAASSKAGARGLVGVNAARADNDCGGFTAPTNQPYDDKTLTDMSNSSSSKAKALAKIVRDIPQTTPREAVLVLTRGIFDFGCQK